MCRDEARKLVDEMGDFLSYGVEGLGSMLKESSNTRMAFKSIAVVMECISKLVCEENKGVVRGLFRKPCPTIPCRL